MIPVAAPLLKTFTRRFFRLTLFRICKFFLERNLFKMEKVPVWVCSNRIGVYAIPLTSSHRPAARKVIVGEIHEPQTVELISNYQPDGDIIHAGAYFGDFLPAFALSRQRGATVWAFEPNRINYSCCQMTILLNELSNVTLFHSALGADASDGFIRIIDETGYILGGGGDVVFQKDVPRSGDPSREKLEPVKIQTLDSVIPQERRVSVIQLDVEGFEQHALSGALRIIRRWKPLLVLESVPEKGWLDRYIYPLGYQLTGKAHMNSIFTPTSHH
jgi:FkbM family methyltransferase